MARKQGLHLRPKLISIAVASCFVTTTALANPTGPTVVHGTASIQQVGNLLKITNSPSAIINWQSFSIGASEITRFIQQSQSSAVLNRVTGSAGVIDPSVILGALQSNGRVFLINPSGILFGAGAQIDVAGLVASSLNLSNADFLANRLKFTDVPGAGSVINQGHITTGAGGPVYLVGSAVTNNGIITSPQGEVVLAAGQSVELVSPGTPNLRVEITAPDNQAINLGTIVADSGRVGIYAGLINNSGTVSASSAVAQGGKILLKATQEVTLESTSILDASGVGGGTIEVLAKNGGTVNVNGRLDASAPVSGDGGFIDTSADAVNVANGTTVTTSAPNGITGLWLVDPADYKIDALAYGGNITGAALSSNLNSTNVTLTSDMGSNPAYGSGSIFVNEAVSWNSPNSLTLIARNLIDQPAQIVNAGTGDIKLYAGWNGASTTTPVVTAGVGSIQIKELISTGGDMVLIAGQHAHQWDMSAGRVVADNLLIESGGTSANFNQNANSVNIVAGKAIQGFHFKNDKTLTVGTVGGVSGINVTSPGSLPASVDIDVEANSAVANLNVNNSITATAGAGYGGNINLNVGGSYGGNISVNNANLIASGVSGNAYGGSSSVSMWADAINVTNSVVKALGGPGSAQGGEGSIYVYADGTGGVTITGSDFQAIGGAGATAADQGDGYVSIGTGVAGGNVMISNSTVQSKGHWAVTWIGADGNVNINNSTVSAVAKTGADGGEGTVFVEAGGTINTGSSTVSATGYRGADFGELPIIDGGEGSGTGVFFSADGSITLGLLSSNEQVSVFNLSGPILDGNAGANVSAPFAMIAGYGGVGSLANPLETVSGGLFLAAYGGEIGVINSGSLVLGGLTNFGSSANAVGATGQMMFASDINTSGNLTLVANNGMLVEQNISSSGDLVMSSGVGTLAFDGVTVTGNNVTLSGNTVQVGLLNTSTAATEVRANNVMKVTTAANLNVLGGANDAADAVLAGTDVDLTVGTVAGFVNINGGANGASAQIAAGSPDTITLFFPTLGAGGYFINGVEGVISDGNTGFFANGEPAVLGDSLKITYGGGVLPPPVQQGIDQVISSTNDQDKEPETNNSDTGLEGDGKEKKELPVCK